MSGWHGREWRRQSRRLVGFDYGGGGWFHVTLVTTVHAPPLSIIENGQAVLTGYGDMVAEEWRRAEELRPYVLIDAFVVMPDHLHGIIAIDVGHSARSAPGAYQSPAHTVGAVVRGFKGATTRKINAWRETFGIPIWQRSYHDRVIDSHRQLEAVREYIRCNPANWDSASRIERESW